MTTPQDPQTGQAQGQQAAQGDAKQYNIPEAVLKQYPDLVELIKKTESMSDEERDYWFQILPIMTEEQVQRLRNILEEEAQQLAKLDEEYKDELSEINKKHLKEWNAFEIEKERKEREAAEEAHEKEEAAEEESILGELDNL